jgi:hypothetical protein
MRPASRPPMPRRSRIPRPRWCDRRESPAPDLVLINRDEGPQRAVCVRPVHGGAGGPQRAAPGRATHVQLAAANTRCCADRPARSGSRRHAQRRIRSRCRSRWRTAPVRSGTLALRDTHAVGDLLLGKTTLLAYLGQPMPKNLSEELLLAGRDGFFPARTLNMFGPNVTPAHTTAHRWSPSSCARSFK